MRVFAVVFLYECFILKKAQEVKFYIFLVWNCIK